MKKKYVLCIVACFILLSVPILYFSVFYGAIPESAEKLSVFLPKYSANIYVNEFNLTDGRSLRMFKLNKKEQSEIQKEIETSELWHLYTENDNRLYDFITKNSEVYDKFIAIDKETCYIAIFDYKDYKFINFENQEDSDSLLLSWDWNYRVMIYDYNRNLYYYIELVS